MSTFQFIAKNLAGKATVAMWESQIQNDWTSWRGAMSQGAPHSEVQSHAVCVPGGLKLSTPTWSYGRRSSLSLRQILTDPGSDVLQSAKCSTCCLLPSAIQRRRCAWQTTVWRSRWFLSAPCCPCSPALAVLHTLRFRVSVPPSSITSPVYCPLLRVTLSHCLILSCVFAAVHLWAGHCPTTHTPLTPCPVHCNQD